MSNSCKHLVVCNRNVDRLLRREKTIQAQLRCLPKTLQGSAESRAPENGSGESNDASGRAFLPRRAPCPSIPRNGSWLASHIWQTSLQVSLHVQQAPCAALMPHRRGYVSKGIMNSNLTLFCCHHIFNGRLTGASAQAVPEPPTAGDGRSSPLHLLMPATSATQAREPCFPNYSQAAVWDLPQPCKE